MPRDWVFPIVLAIFVAVVVWFSRQIHDFLLPPSDTVTIPSFVGQTLTDANAEIARLKLTSAVVDHTPSDRYPKNVVIMQRPDAGEQAREGRQISFVISDGIIARLMPDLRYQSMREVQLDLSRVRMKLGKVTYVKSDIIPEGHVISQDPAPLSSVAQGDVVNLVVSRGGLSVLQVPTFTGMLIDQARALAQRTGVKLGQIVWTPLGPNGPPHGAVVRQIPAPNGKIASFEPVSLQVSAGPYESGYVIRQVRLLVSVPVPDQAQNPQNGQGVTTAENPQQLDVRVTVTDATGKYDLYHAFAEPGQKLDFTVTAIGTSLVDMYVNDALAGETRLGAEPPAIYGKKATPSPVPAQ
ncbi:MAG: PASTA domain-containing protein [Candidatus Eremiobacteraeota bacterium]|nr:PASTA domain-containing protein [Candidatus Eremiobacteraeota bacterium]